MASGVVWVVATILGVVFGFADAAGLPIDHPDLWRQLTEYVWTLGTLRVALISALAAAMATTAAAMSLTRKGIATAAFLAVASLLPLALAGHAAGNADPRPPSTPSRRTWSARRPGSADCWARRAAARCRPAPAHRRRPILRHGAVVLRRRRGLRVVSAVIRLGGIGELGNLPTAYGALILVKTACLVVLGLLGWQQRRRVVGRMAVEGPGHGLFVRFAVTELIVMAVAVGFATALSRTPAPPSPPGLDTSTAWALTGYPKPTAPVATTWLTLWRFD